MTIWYLEETPTIILAGPPAGFFSAPKPFMIKPLLLGRHIQSSTCTFLLSPLAISPSILLKVPETGHTSSFLFTFPRLSSMDRPLLPLSWITFVPFSKLRLKITDTDFSEPQSESGVPPLSPQACPNLPVLVLAAHITFVLPVHMLLRLETQRSGKCHLI